VIIHHLEHEAGRNEKYYKIFDFFTCLADIRPFAIVLVVERRTRVKADPRKPKKASTSKPYTAEESIL